MSNSDGKELRTQVEQNKLRILFLTDTHLGFLENDPIRGQDSFNSFSEILELAKKYDVDLILHGGDLYHDNRPSKNTENQCIQLIRSHTFGNKQLKFEFLSNKDYRANFEANQFSISYPIFAIHGNHDDRAGSKRVSALDILHSAGIINLFGNFDNVSSNIEIEPLLFSKGSTRLALFGIGEENLDCFNLFLIHQNHVRHGSTTKYIPETMLPKSLDLVLWGHEHDCFADPEYNELTGFHVIQPGSSVATQLTAGESKPKHCLIIDIEGKSFVSHKVPIKSARPFYFEDFIHAYHKIRTDDTNAKEKTIEACENRVRSILKHWRDNGDTNLKPLIRIRVPFSSDGFETFSNLNFGQKFVGNVANPNDIIIFHKLSSRINNSSSHNQASNSRLNNGANNELRAKFIEQSDASDDYNANSQMLYDITQQYIAKYGGFNILNTGKFSRSLAEFIEKDEYNSINEYVESSIKSTTGQLQLILDEIEDCESSKYMEIVDFSKFYTTQLDNIRKRDEAIHIQEDTKSLLKKEDAEADEITISGIEEPLEKRTKESLSDLDNKTDQIESISQLSVNLSTTISNSQISHNSERKATHKTRKPRKLFNIPTI